MIPLRHASAFVWACTLAASASANFESGVAAYRSGDYAKAFYEFQIAADKGDPRAQLNLGLLFDEGKGVEQDYAAAVRWYRSAADNGSVLAQVNLGAMYFAGLGVERDFKAAASWYRRAALAGNATAQYNLAYLYEKGLGVGQDLVQALAWISIAATLDGTIPPEEVEALAAKLSDGERAQAEELYHTYFETEQEVE